MSESQFSRNIQSFVDQRWAESIVPALCEYIRIPNKSPAFDPNWEAHGHMARAVTLLESWAMEAGVGGLKTEVVTLPGRTPLLLAEVPETGACGTFICGQ